MSECYVVSFMEVRSFILHHLNPGFSLLLLGIFNPPGSLRSVKSAQSFSTAKTSGELPPPPPPPFPKDLEKGAERVIFL